MIIYDPDAVRTCLKIYISVSHSSVTYLSDAFLIALVSVSSGSEIIMLPSNVQMAVVLGSE